MEAIDLASAITNLDRSSRRLIVCTRAGERSEAWARIGDRARRVAAELQARGLHPGDVILVVGDVTIELVETISAAILSGSAVSVVTTAARQRKRGVAAEITSRAVQLGVRAVLVDRSGVEFDAAVRGTIAVWRIEEIVEGARRRRATDFEEVDIEPNSTAVLQFTSGVTGEPRVVRISHSNVASYFAALRRAVPFDPTTETLVSWLPLAHDMGLIGYLFGGLISGAGLLLASPDLFVVRPHLWLSWISRFPNVQSAAPGFAYGVVARSPRPLAGLDLSSWRLAFNGGEQISVDDVTRFCDVFAPAGFRHQSFVASYGLAEATLAVTAAVDGRGMAWDTVDRHTLAAEGVANPTATKSIDTEVLALLGTPLDCVRVRITDHTTGSPLPERHVGEIQVSGSTVTDGYVGTSDSLDGLFDGEWLRTGDRGYMTGGELVLCGRWKDLIVIGGRNLAPQQVEGVAERYANVRPGSVAAIGIPSTKRGEKLVLVASLPRRLHTNAVVRTLIHGVHLELGVTASDVVFVDPGAIPRTLSGKLQRRVCRDRYLAGELEPGRTKA
jgi:fatty-acyl-CoA synthase